MYLIRLALLKHAKSCVIIVSLGLILSRAHAEDYGQASSLDKPSAQALIAKFREASPASAYYLEFTLNLIPRHADTTRIPGRLWASHNLLGNIWRIELNPGQLNEKRYIIQNGSNASVWQCDLHGTSPNVRRVSLLTALFEGSEISAFDLQMPYLYWPDIQVLGLSRIRGRPSYQFVFKAPSALALESVPLGGVRAYLDTQYNAPVQTELISNQGKILKTLTLGDLKKIQGQWIPKTIDMRNELTRNKTQFEVNSGVLGLELSRSVFNPADLPTKVIPPLQTELTLF
jgi:hypothetical protein